MKLGVTGSSPVVGLDLFFVSKSLVGGNGRRDRLKICSLYKGVGSIPILSDIFLCFTSEAVFIRLRRKPG